MAQTETAHQPTPEIPFEMELYGFEDSEGVVQPVLHIDPVIAHEVALLNNWRVLVHLYHYHATTTLENSRALIENLDLETGEDSEEEEDDHEPG